MTINQITAIIIEECIYIHKTLGPGLFESIYEEVLCHRLEKRGISYERQKAVPVVFEEIKMELGFRADVIVDGKVIVEIKSLDILPPVAEKQVVTYLKLTGLQIGLLINFNVPKLVDGIERIANNYREEMPASG